VSRAALLLVLLAGVAACPGGDTHVFSARYELRGGLRGVRDVDDRAGGRVTCAVDVDPRDPLDSTPILTLAVVSAADGRRQPGLYFTVRNFRGQGGYVLADGMERGQVIVFDEATLADCGRADDSQCHAATRGCFLLLESWLLGEAAPPGVRAGTGSGRFACERLENAATGDRVTITEGTFSCRATDWTATRR
jgi:hypothetical protein